MKKILKWLGIGVAALLTIMVANMLLKAPKALPEKESVNIVTDTPALRHLAEAMRFRTISYDEDSLNRSLRLPQLTALHAWMKRTYPMLAKMATWETVNGGSLLISLKGQTELRPALFLAHLDVVPAPDSAQWNHAPFAGRIHRDTLTGRGTLDDKNTAIAMLEAIEGLLREGKRPKRGILFAFGHDEELGGPDGAARIAALLKSRNIRAEFIADEGFGVMEGVVPGLDRPCAIIGLAEKGNLSLKLTVKTPGGHSGWPEPDNATAILQRALGHIEQYQFEARLDGPLRGLFEQAGPYMHTGYRFLFSNLWITSPLVKKVLLGGAKTAASIRTTHVTTVLRSGDKDNVVPSEAYAIVNFRLLPGDRIADVERTISEVISDDRVRMERYLDHHEASAVSPDQGPGYDQINAAIRACFPNTVVVPGMVITGTDCKNYTDISDRIYRFVPFTLGDHNLGGIHGRNEYITLKQMSQAVAYYRHLFSLL